MRVETLAERSQWRHVEGRACIRVSGGPHYVVAVNRRGATASSDDCVVQVRRMNALTHEQNATRCAEAWLDRFIRNPEEDEKHGERAELAPEAYHFGDHYFYSWRLVSINGPREGEGDECRT